MTSLARNDESYRRLFERHPQAMWVYDPETLRFLAVNDAAVETYGYSRDEFLSLTIADIRPAEDLPALLAAVPDGADGRLVSGRWRHRRKDGSEVLVRVTSSPLDFDGRPARLVLAEDVTAQSRLETELQEARMLEAIGSLAGGIAHDFNNTLLVIRGHASAVLEHLDAGPIRSSVKQIDRAAAYAAEFTHQLLAFSRQQILEPELLDLNELVSEVVAMLSRLLGDEIVVELRLDPSADPVLVDRSRLVQAILNLLVNARDAMPAGGLLTIRTANVQLADAEAERLEGIVPGSHVALEVSDTGVGMDANTQSRVFEPFFTTKENGSGFGLATVFGLVRQSEGAIEVESEPGRGTTFTLYFPRAGDEVAEPAESPNVESLAGTETVLLVEDATAVRTLIADILAEYGYTVLAAEDGERALELARRHAGAVDVLITDVALPNLSGPAVAERVLAIEPDVRVLFTSGLPPDESFDAPAGVHFRFIEKPFLPHDLARKLRELVD